MTGDLRAQLADDELVAFIESVRASAGSPALTVVEQRDQQVERVRMRPRGPDVDTVMNLVIPGYSPINARLYLPEETPSALLVYFHGGGWSIGSLDSHDAICRHIVAGSGLAVVAIDYRLAPENPWPASINDAMVAVGWAMTHVRTLAGTSYVAVGGDSSGGHLAAVTCLLRRDMGDPQPVLQFLLYPNLDLTLSQPSMQSLGEGWIPSRAGLSATIDQWLPDAVDRAHPRVSPLLEPDLSGLAPALILTAEFDPLRDDGALYARRLADAGVPVTYRDEPAMIHGFLTFGANSPAANAARDRAIQQLRETCGTSVPGV